MALWWGSSYVSKACDIDVTGCVAYCNIRNGRVDLSDKRVTTTLGTTL